ncbi:LADA_0C03708g1_1 [Lachancea dasiensis]|uniref:LADA_0C03708g1_1 n=1 Tax=Lachancea dasiensis TaxID=1072105 RepID=A0A1G4IYZ6_9SACH|nr:LADA_0C03708g1_1 [Lachancea dasiensis]
MYSSDDEPFRIAILGGSATGKSSLVSRLTVGMAPEVHYPTRKQNKWLFSFDPTGELARTLMDERPHQRQLVRTGILGNLLFESPQITPLVLLSPVMFQAFANEWKETRKLSLNQNSKQSSRILDPRNEVYNYEQRQIPEGTSSDHSRTMLTNSDTNIRRTILANNQTHSSTEFVLPKGYDPPTFSPISVDIVDTPGFNPDMVVPFLEVSLFRNLDKDVLKGLANEPKKPVSTTSLLTASGASDLNGSINGYIFVYSAVPELNHGAEPPTYDDAGHDDNLGLTAYSSNDSRHTSITPVSSNASAAEREPDGGLFLLTTIRNCILDAWAEFRDYQQRWAEGKEGDVYSVMYNFKQMWKSQKQRDKKLKQLRSFHTKPNAVDWNASSPNSPPPCIIICTHVNDSLASPLLLERGQELALNWGCSFVGIDSIDNCNVEVALALLVREFIEKQKIIKSASKNVTK